MGLTVSASGIFNPFGGVGYVHTPAVTGIVITLALPASGAFSQIFTATLSATGSTGYGALYGGNLPASIVASVGFPVGYFPGMSTTASGFYTTSSSGFASNRPIDSS